MTIVLDTGALIAIDRGRRDLLSRLQADLDNGDRIRARAGVIAQVGGTAVARPSFHLLSIDAKRHRA